MARRQVVVQAVVSDFDSIHDSTRGRLTRACVRAFVRAYVLGLNFFLVPSLLAGSLGFVHAWADVPLSEPAAAGQVFPPQEARLVEVTGAHLHLHDLFPAAPREIVLRPAPRPGRELFLAPSLLQAWAHRYGLAWDASKASNASAAGVRLRRAAYIVPHEVVLRALRAAVADKLRAVPPGNPYNQAFEPHTPAAWLPESEDVASDPQPVFEIVPNAASLELVLSTAQGALLELDGIRFDFVSWETRPDGRQGRFAARLVLASDELSDAASLVMRGRFFELLPSFVAARTLRRGTRLRAADLEQRWVRADRLPADALTDRVQILGQETKYTLAQGAFVRAGRLRAPILVSRGHLTQVVYQDRGVVISMVLKALDDGTYGESIRFKNPQTNRVVEAVVSGDGQAAVQHFEAPLPRSPPPQSSPSDVSDVSQGGS